MTASEVPDGAVTVAVQARDAAYGPLDNASVAVQVTPPDAWGRGWGTTGRAPHTTWPEQEQVAVQTIQSSFV